MELIKPASEHLPAYCDALRRGWSPDNLRSNAGQEQLRKVGNDPAAFLVGFDDRQARGGPVTLPDGSQAARLPSIRRWIWHDGFCGHIGLRWQVGTEALPPTCLGHIGYAVVPWRRREGLATAALLAILPEAKAVGLRHVIVTTDPDNRASIGVIERAGGVFIGRFEKPPATGEGEELRFKIELDPYRRWGAGRPP